MEENLANDINQKLEILSKRCDELEKDNINYKKKLQMNQDNIYNLLVQLKIIRKEYNKELIALKENFTQQIKNINQIEQKNKNEIIINDENNDLIDFKKIKEYIKEEIKKEINNILQKQLKELKNEIYLNVEKNILEEKKEKIDEIIKYKDGDIKNRFENKLFNIFSDKRQEIPEKDMNELKKLGTAFLIKYKLSPLDASKVFLKTNIQINKEIDEISNINNEIKKSNIFIVMNEIMLRKLDKNNQTKYLKDFREKYGIEDNEISDKEIIKYMKKNDEKKIIEAVLKKLKYIK